MVSRVSFSSVWFSVSVVLNVTISVSISEHSSLLKVYNRYHFFSILIIPTIIPTSLISESLSLSSGQFHPILKQSIISPLLKKSTLDIKTSYLTTVLFLTFLSYLKLLNVL